ncbi:MAG TPA: response regulator, partial [Candidatus Baltobacteraceae bacterium]|nr:response regulator [Candidatus Baltobacteraceae bacterium]
MTQLSARRRRVLVVDDEPAILEVVKAYLEREGLSVETASGVEETRRALERGAVDLLVLDIALPDGSGLDVLRAAFPNAHVPTIVLTSRSGEADRIVGLELGADDYV